MQANFIFGEFSLFSLIPQKKDKVSKNYYETYGVFLKSHKGKIFFAEKINPFDIIPSIDELEKLPNIEIKLNNEGEPLMPVGISWDCAKAYIQFLKNNNPELSIIALANSGIITEEAAQNLAKWAFLNVENEKSIEVEPKLALKLLRVKSSCETGFNKPNLYQEKLLALKPVEEEIKNENETPELTPSQKRKKAAIDVTATVV